MYAFCTCGGAQFSGAIGDELAGEPRLLGAPHGGFSGVSPKKSDNPIYHDEPSRAYFSPCLWCLYETVAARADAMA